MGQAKAPEGWRVGPWVHGFKLLFVYFSPYLVFFWLGGPKGFGAPLASFFLDSAAQKCKVRKRAFSYLDHSQLLSVLSKACFISSLYAFHSI